MCAFPIPSRNRVRTHGKESNRLRTQQVRASINSKAGKRLRRFQPACLSRIWAVIQPHDKQA